MTRRAVFAQLEAISQCPPTLEEQCLAKHASNRNNSHVAHRVAVALRSGKSSRSIQPRPGFLLPPY